MPRLLQFIAKGMFTFRIGWTTLSLKFLDIVTFSLTSSPEKKNSELLPMQHENAYTLEKKEKTFLPKTNFVFACLCKLFPHFLPFSLCIPARLAIISRVTWIRCEFVLWNVARLSKFIPHFVVQHEQNLSLHNKTHLLFFVQQLVLLLFSAPMRDLLFHHLQGLKSSQKLRLYIQSSSLVRPSNDPESKTEVFLNQHSNRMK